MSKQKLPVRSKPESVEKPAKSKQDIIVKCAADFMLPLALVFGFAVIMHGHLSPGGGFQGGVLVAGAVLLMFLAYDGATVAHYVKSDLLKKHESIAAVCYVGLALLGVFAGAVFFQNVIFDNGQIGDLISAGNIVFMNYAVGYQVLTGVAFLLLLMIGLLTATSGSDEDEADESYEEHFASCLEYKEAKNGGK